MPGWNVHSPVVAHELRDRRGRRAEDAAEVVLGQDGVALTDAQAGLEDADEGPCAGALLDDDADHHARVPAVEAVELQRS